MDNQMFPGGSFVVDDGPQGCSLCGLLFNNSISLQHHMQFHILSANPQLLPVNQGPDLGLGLNAAAAANLMDLIACASSSSSSMVPGQPMFTSVPSHLLTANLGLVSNPLQPLQLSQPVPKVKEKKTKSSSSKSSAAHSSIDTTPTSSHSSRNSSSASSRASQSSSSSSSSFMPSFPKDLSSKSDTAMVTKAASKASSKSDRQVFQSPFDPIEEALALPTYSKSSFERQISGSMSSTVQPSQPKEPTKLFQPFSTNDDSVGYNIPKTTGIFSADHLLSPVKSTLPEKPLDLDILTTPQKLSYHGSNDSLSTSPKSSTSSEFSRKATTSSKAAVTSSAEPISMKSMFYPSIMDPLNVSPKASTQPFRESSDLAAMPAHFGGSRSSSPQTSTSNELFAAQAPAVTPSMLSPKISLGLPTVPTESVPGKLFANSSDEASASGSATSTSVFINPPLAVPDIAQISNGTGYFNALTQKLINPGLSLTSDFAKLNPTSSSSFENDNQKNKSYFENGILISHDYDKISDTNDEDDLDRLIDGIDTKETHIDKGYSEIEDLLNEFNENHPEDITKHKSQMDDFLLNDVLTDSAGLKSDVKPETSTVTDDLINLNNSAICELIEKENEVIDKESKMLESARLKSLTDVPKTSEAGEEEEETASAPVSAATASVDTPATAQAEAKPPERKDDDQTDFEIPKVGKLMKIRKYFESQEQKKKQEKTEAEKEAEIKIKEKGPAVIEEKPQTILVQVSKRKKIEYGPYINKQSLLEGKPTGKEADSPPKTFRPKPKPPQVPVRSNFNLRARKTKTDFASLASKGSKTPDVKKGEEKLPKTVDTCNKVKPDDKVGSGEENKSGDDKIRTRNKDKREKEKVEKEQEVVEKTKDSSESAVGEKKEGRPNLRMRTAEKASKPDTSEVETKSKIIEKTNKGETGEVEGKSLRRRTVKTSPEGLKIKITKQDQCSKSDHETSADEISRRKVLRHAQKPVLDKPGIKKCSVNLGENLSESKIKTVMRTSCNKDKEVLGSSREDVNADHEKVKDDASVDEIVLAEIPIPEASPPSKGKKTRSKQGVKVKEKHTTNAEELNSLTGPAAEKTEDKIDRKDVVDGEEIVPNKCVINAEIQSEKKPDIETVVHAEKQNGDNTNDTSVALLRPETQVKEITNDTVVEKVSLKIKLGGEFQRKYQEGLSNARKRKSGFKSWKREIRHEKKAKLREVKTARKLALEASGTIEKPKEEIEIVIENEPKEKVVPVNQIIVEDEVTETLAETCHEEPKVEPEVGETELKESEVKETEVKEKEFIEPEIRENKAKDTEIIKENEVKETEITKIEVKETEVKEIEVQEIVEVKKTNDKQDPENEFQKITADQACNKSDTSAVCGAEIGKDSNAQTEAKKKKHSVENEFQRLVDEAMAAVKNETDEAEKPSRYSNLRKRLNESIRYNVDDSDDDVEIPFKMAYYPVGAPIAKGPKQFAKHDKKGFLKMMQTKKFVPSIKPQVKKDVDIYDFTDTEMSDKEEEMPSKLSFKPKYVTNIKSFGHIPFVSKSLSSSPAQVTEDVEDTNKKADTEESAYVGKTVEPLKIKLTKIIPYVEKKHKHKKKKRKKDKKRRNSRDESFETIDSTDERGSVKCVDNETVVNNEQDYVDKNAETLEDSNSNECNDEESDSPQGRGIKTFKIKEKKSLEKKHMCIYCNQGFGQKCDLRKHIMIHTGERPYPCNICEKRFLRKTDLVKHTRTHTGEKPYACEFCDKRVSDKSQLNVHRRLHTGDRPYQCTKCGKGCITSSELTRHRAVHCSDNTHVCELCKKTFKIKECLGMHMKMHYRSRSRAVKCNKCSFGFDRILDLERHKCSALAKDVYICGECLEEFSDEMLYGEHIQTHDLDVFSCNMCTHIFEDKASLETHLCNLGVDKQPVMCKQEATDTGPDDEVGSFMCDLCPEMFAVRKHFLAHLKSHETTKAAHGNIKKSPPESQSPSETISAGRNAFEQLKVNTNNVLKEASLRENLFSNPENLAGLSAGSRNNTRASVISGSFRNTDCSGGKYEGRVRGARFDGNGSKSDPLTPLCQTGSVFESGVTGIVGNRSHGKLPESEKLFDTTEFSNSPDFSSLTDDGSLSFDLYQKYSPGARGDVNNQARNFNRLSDMSPPAAVTAAEIAEKKEIEQSTHNVTSPLNNPPAGSAQSQTEYRWPYQIPAPDYVNSLLNKMGSEDPGCSTDFTAKQYGVKVDGRENVFPKSEALLTGSSGRTAMEGFKDNIENHSKSNIFLDFDCSLPSQKADGFQSGKNLQQKFGSPNSTDSAFQGLSQNLYNLTRNRQQYQNENYSTFLNTFHSNSLFTAGNSANLFGPSNHDKRSSSSNMFSDAADPMHNNYYLTVEDSLKGTSPSDKTDETTALLSNFDYSMS